MPKTHDLGNHETVFPVSLCLPDVHLPKRLGLDGIDDLDLEILLQQVPIHTQPVMTGCLHANEQVFSGNVQARKQTQQLFTAFLAVGKGDAV
ncbi:Uncharacterised protein [uncultured Blautia sp.]|nr:Uncharacterised protein [uncultured Blautia sp.]